MIAPHITLFLMRHGETVWNTERRLQGSKHDSPLTERDEAQARTVGHILSKHLDAATAPRFVASPAGRAQATMRIILETLGLDSNFTADDRIAEIDLGNWSGFTSAHVREHDKANWGARNADRWNVPVPGGEVTRLAP